MKIHLNIVTCATYPEKFIHDNVVAPSVQTCHWHTAPLTMVDSLQRWHNQTTAAWHQQSGQHVTETHWLATSVTGTRHWHTATKKTVHLSIMQSICSQSRSTQPSSPATWFFQRSVSKHSEHCCHVGGPAVGGSSSALRRAVSFDTLWCNLFSRSYDDMRRQKTDDEHKFHFCC